MQLQISRSDLLQALTIVGQATQTRGTMPVYSGAKVLATADRIVLLATDLEAGIRYEMPGLAVEGEPGAAILPVGRLTAILRETPDEAVRLDMDGNRIRVETLASEFEMPAEDPATFADIAEVTDDDACYDLAAADLKRMIRRTLFSAAKDEGKYAMRGVLWDVNGRELKLVATDGKRLAVATGACGIPTESSGAPLPHEPTSRLLPPKAMQLLERILADGDEKATVRVYLRPNDALFRTDRATIYSRLVEGRFPPYRDVIPKKANAKVPLAAGAFLSAVRQAEIMTDEESKRIEFSFAGDRLTLKAHGATTGKSEVRMPMAGYEGPHVTISFDPQYIKDILRVVESTDTLELSLVDGDKSAVFRLGDGFLALVVPLV